MKVEIDSNLLWRFRFNACDNQKDGYDRGLWYDKEEKRFFQTCETSSTNYTFDNPNNIIQLIFIKGDNNWKGIEQLCENCVGCDGEDKGDCFYDVCLAEYFDEHYPISPINCATRKIEDIEFVEV